MAQSRNYQLSLSFAVTTILLFSLTFLPFESDGIEASILKDELQKRKLILGSRPPACVNKCLNCRPCKATLVIPPHHRFNKNSNFVNSSFLDTEDDTYYLLSWKCRCGNKLYQP